MPHIGTSKKSLFAFVLIFQLIFMASMTHAQQTTNITLPTYQGRISVSPNGRYFVDEAGQGFIVIGQNDAISWPGLNTLLDGTAPEQTGAYIRDLRVHGVTVSRIMFEYAQQASSLLENPIGTFNDEVVAFWDAFIRMAEEHGLYLLLTPYDTFWQNSNWSSYPYNAANGGPCETRREWLTGASCIEAQKDRWRFIIDRWGGSPNIFAWDIMNEVELWWGNTTEEVAAYIDEMAAFVREYSISAWGHAPMISVSSAAAVPEGGLGRVIYRHPALDFANTHLYIGDINAPDDPILPGNAMAGGVVLSLQQITDMRPYFDSESGPIEDWIVNPLFDQEYHNNMSWAHLASCGAGTGMRWPYTNPHFILPELRDNLLAIARFATSIDWANFSSENITLRVLLSDRRVYRAACSDGQTGIVWMVADTRDEENAGVIPGMTVTINDVFEDGTYTVQYWDTYMGNILQTEEVTATDEILVLTVPPFEGIRSLVLGIHAN